MGIGEDLPELQISEKRIIEEEKEKPADWLPVGTDNQYVQRDREWPTLEKRLGQPRILNNVYFPEVLDWINKKYGSNSDDFSYFEAGCGHGNDLRAIRNKLKGKGLFLGVDMSEAEINRGLDFYKQQETLQEGRKLFAQGDLRDLSKVNIWSDENGDFSKSVEIKNGEFDLVYFEAVLHGLGYGGKTYQEKKELAQRMFNELFRICKVGGKIFGRANAFTPDLTQEQRFEFLRKINEWHFSPDPNELKDMLKKAGFENIKTDIKPHEKSEEDAKRKDFLKVSFLAEKQIEKK